MTFVSRRSAVAAIGGAALSTAAPSSFAQSSRMQSWSLGARNTGIHDVAPASDRGVWFSAQASGHLGYFDPASGRTELIALGSGSSPHGVIQGPDKAAWLTDGGQNAIVRVAWPDRTVKVYPLPAGSPRANLNTCAFDGNGDLWFTGQNGVLGKVAVKTGQVTARQSPRGHGPYGICATPSGDIWYCSLAQSFIAKIDVRTGESSIHEPPTRSQGARRVWSDSKGRIWVSEWNSGQLSVFDPQSDSWRQWKLPGNSPRTYAVYVDDKDTVWVSDWGSNAVLSFDQRSQKFERHAIPREGANIRQILGRPGEVWLPESGTEHITVIRT
jgi:virginiamycin B lyase